MWKLDKTKNREERTPIKAKREGRAPLALCKPTALFESGGELFIVDSGLEKVFKVLRDDHVVVIAGGGEEVTDGKPAHKSKLREPSGIYVSNRNEVFISERGGNCIRKIDTDGNIRTICGTGIAGYNGDGIALDCQLNEPTGILVTELDQVLFVDFGNEMIRMIEPNGKIKTIATNVNGSQLSMDENGVIYFFSSNDMMKLLPNGNLEKVQRKPVKQTGPIIHPFTDIVFHRPFDIKVRNGKIYYSERLFLRRVDQDGSDTILAKIESIQRPVTRRKVPNPMVLVFPSNDGTVYMSDDMRGTIWRSFVTNNNNVLKELMCKSEIPFDNIKEYPHIGPRAKRINRCCEFHDITIQTNIS